MLGTPPAFVLSQDQTLLFNLDSLLYFFSLSLFGINFVVQNFKYSFKSLSCFDLSFFSSLCTFQGAFLAFPQPLRFRSASLYYQTSRFLSTAFLSFSQKYFPRPTSLLKVRPPLSRCSRSIYLFAVFCNYFFMNFICFIRVLYVELTRGTLYLVAHAPTHTML